MEMRSGSSIPLNAMS